MADKKHVDEYRKALRMLCDFAYKQGFHEMGYDPLEAFEAALRDQFNAAPQATPEAADKPSGNCAGLGSPAVAAPE
jgi:hypothetical protein